MALTIQKLNAQHDVNSFSCGEPDLDDWLQRFARQHEKKSISKTYVLVDEADPKTIRGFYAITICTVDGTDLPEAMRKKLPRNVPGYKIGRLARDLKFRGEGVGELLLVDAMMKAKYLAGVAGGFALFVDAKNQKAADFYADFGFVPLPDNPLQLLIPMASIPDA